MGSERYAIGQAVEVLRVKDARERGSFDASTPYRINGLTPTSVEVDDNDGRATLLPRAWVEPAAPTVQAVDVAPAANPRAASGFASTPTDHAAIADAYLNGQRSSRNDAPEPIGLDPIVYWQAVELVDMARAQAHLAMADHLATSPLSTWYRVRELSMVHARAFMDAMPEANRNALKGAVRDAGIGGISVPDRFANYVADLDLGPSSDVSGHVTTAWWSFLAMVHERAAGAPPADLG